ncbi:hypothetical protein SAMN02745883_01202 [Caminicella sporogenes DSM 14501]|uniref:DUF5320 domain-containing protein n=1 Tax=Caminicella sporogenes DSM 14501 TaxID=1121266 RepID=A0A1M6PGU3_9FIRM|nr:DUF5320 domain-containing protein [Caminicella sporogenes]RKD21404.1 hypothetical protein BET04_08160 [Caminicella sporogenes]WIF95457.1 DUF5320 domain-containing protein [Caminicella sporogenes]SHK07178.1 hypothetical protein SAMN02745883_01202 [Caminicella sporogenes DSM 14501]
MPRLDGTGPLGLGPMTGRGAGRCSGEYTGQRRIFGRGFFGRRCGGFGFRRGNRFMYKLTGLPRWARSGYYEDGSNIVYDEEKFLKAQENVLENELKRVKELLQNFKKNDNKDDKVE